MENQNIIKETINETATDFVGDKVKEFIYEKIADGISEVRKNLDTVEDDGSFGGTLAKDGSMTLGYIQPGLNYVADPNKFKEDALPILDNTQNALYNDSIQNFSVGNNLIATYQESAAESIEGVESGLKLATNPSEGLLDVGNKFDNLGQSLTDYSQSGSGFTNYLAGDLGAGATNIGEASKWAGNTIEEKTNELTNALNTIKDEVINSTIEAKDAGTYIGQSGIKAVTNLGTEIVNSTIEAKDAGAYIKDSFVSDMTKDGSIIKDAVVDKYKEVKNDLINQFTDYKDVTTPVDMTISDAESAILSEKSYSDAKKETFTDKDAFNEWQPVDNDSNLLSGFAAVTYLNKKTHEIKIVYVGTDNIPDYIADIELATGFLPTQAYDALNYTKKEISKYPGYTFNYAGHSLGGHLAELMARIFGTKATTVDSPGLNNYEDKWINEQRSILNLNGKADITYIINNTAVSAQGMHRGKEINLDNITLDTVRDNFGSFEGIGWLMDSPLNIINKVKNSVNSFVTDHLFEGHIKPKYLFRFGLDTMNNNIENIKQGLVSNTIVDKSNQLEQRSATFGHGWLSSSVAGTTFKGGIAGGGGGGAW
jgi:hypothetical protein